MNYKGAYLSNIIIEIWNKMVYNVVKQMKGVFHMKNNVSIANFNITFGKEERPLLEYFDTIVMPAFTSNLKRVYRVPGSDEKDVFYFLNVKIVDAGNEDYFIIGHIIRETVLEVKTVVEDNKLINKNSNYPSAPYSTFYIRLRNHRMVLIKNQKESPDIRNFATTVRNIFSGYRNNVNKQLKDNNQKILPYITVNVVGIPMREGLEQTFKEIKKINRLTLRFFPLNGDLNLTKTTESITKEIREPAGANTGSLVLNSCENKQGVLEILDGLQGVMEPTLNVDFTEAKGVTIRNDKFSERLSWDLKGDDLNNIQKVIPKFYETKSLNMVTEENNKIYSKFINKIKHFFEL